jgi:hypothetical protein
MVVIGYVLPDTTVFIFVPSNEDELGCSRCLESI